VVAAEEGGVAALGTRDSWEWFQLAAAEAPRWRNETTLRSLERLLDYAPGRFIDRIAPTPLLLMPAEADFIPLDIALAAFARAGEPKKLLVLPAGHFSAYEPPHFAAASSAAAEWFAEHLTR
jgi:fermentation-respiration switch protein FrsA (DUF1100 family)